MCNFAQNSFNCQCYNFIFRDAFLAMSMASKIKVRGIISMAWFIELGSIFGIEDSAANLKIKTYFLFVENQKLEL